MKAEFRSMPMLLLLLTVPIFAAAQNNPGEGASVPNWVSKTGYWVVVTNIKTPKSNVVHFYSNDNVEIYTERVEGIKLDISRPKVCMRLNRVLDQSLEAWALRWGPERQDLVKWAFKMKNNQARLIK